MEYSTLALFKLTNDRKTYAVKAYTNAPLPVIVGGVIAPAGSLASIQGADLSKPYPTTELVAAINATPATPVLSHADVDGAEARLYITELNTSHATAQITTAPTNTWVAYGVAAPPSTQWQLFARPSYSNTDAADLPNSAVFPAVFIELECSDGVARLSSLPRTVVWSGRTWHGVGTLGGIGELVEGLEARSYNLTLSLAGVPGDFRGYLLTQKFKNKTLRAFYGTVDDNLKLTAPPLLKWQGRVDTQGIEITGGQFTITLEATSDLVDYDRAKNLFYDAPTQARTHPTDRGFEYVASLQMADIKFGRV